MAWVAAVVALVFSACVLHTAAAAGTTTFYVNAHTGSDTNNGTSRSAPFLTPTRALAALRTRHDAGSAAQVLLAPGVYPQTAPLVMDTAAGAGDGAGGVLWTTDVDADVDAAGVVRSPHAGEAGGSSLASLSPLPTVAQLAGGVAVDGWTRSSGAELPSSILATAVLWRAPLPATVTPNFTDVYLGGRALRRARTPNLGQFLVWNSSLCAGNLHKKPPPPCANEARYGFVYSAGDVDPSWPTAEPNAQFMVYHGWTASRHHLRSVVDANRTVWFKNPSDQPIGFWSNVNSEGGGRYFVENILSGLDEADEWYYDTSKNELLVLLAPGLDPNSQQVVVPQTEQLVTISGARNIRLTNLQLGFTNFVCGPTTVCDKQSSSWQTTSGIEVANSSNVTLDHNEILGTGAYSVWITGNSSNVNVLANDMHDLGSGAIRVGSESVSAVPRLVRVEDNLLHNGSLSFPSGTPILVQKAANVTVLHNEACFFSYAGISVGWSWNYADPSFTDNVTVAYNHVHDLGTGTYRQLGDAMAAVYTLGVLNGTYVHHNLLHDVYAWYTGGYCLSQDQGSSHILFENNVCHATTGASQTQHYGVGNTYRNNIFSTAGYQSWTTENTPGIRTVPDPTQPSSFSFTNNIVYATNESNFLFEGDYVGQTSPAHDFSFQSNLYWSTVSGAAIAKNATWGGCDHAGRVCGEGKLTFAQWQGGCGTSATSSPSNCTGPKQDVDSLVANPGFADAAAMDFALPKNSPAFQIGFKPIDVSTAGPRGPTGPKL